MGTVAELWRHPIKAHGREPLAAVDLTQGNCMPWDRHWAVTHQDTKFDGTGWVMCRNFMIGSRAPKLAGIWAEFDEVAGVITLRHQDLGEVTFKPDEDAAAFLEWITPLCPPERSAPKELVTLNGRGMTDSPFASISITNPASHKAVEAAIGRPLEMERWRSNIWLDGFDTWQELDWIGKTLRIGSVELEVREPIVRCLLTASNPITGVRDADTIGTLNNSFGHQHFGVYAVVTKNGHIALGDQAQVL